MPTNKRVYRAPALEACGTLRTSTGSAEKDTTTLFDSPDTNDIIEVVR